MRAQSVPPGKNETKRDFILPTWRQNALRFANAVFVRKLFPIRMCSGCGKAFQNFVKFGSFACKSNYVLHNSIEIRFSR
jgi:protein-arginine kinase activator protein McsA